MASTAASMVSTMTYVNATAGNDSGVDSMDGNVFTRECSVYLFVTKTVFIGTLCVVGLVGNVVAFMVFCKDNIKTSTSFLFQTLSFIDSVLLVLCFPLYSIEPLTYYPGGIFPNYASLVQPFIMVYVFPLAMIAQTSTIWTTVLVAINRYIAVCKPYQASRLCTVVQAKRQIAVVFVCAVLYNMPIFFEGRIKHVVDEHGSRYEADYTALGKNQEFNIAYHIVAYLLFLLTLPLLILTILNIRLIRALKEIKKRRAEMQSLRQQQDNNVTLVLIIVVLVFSVCQAPALINHICWIILDEKARQCGHFQFYFSPLSNMLVITNSAVNFLIYFLFNTRFRQVLIENICKKEFKQGYQKQRNNTLNHNKEPTDVDGTQDTLL